MSEDTEVPYFNPRPLLESLTVGLTDRQLKTFAIACYAHQRMEPYLSDEAKVVLELMQAELDGEKTVISRDGALEALKTEAVFSSFEPYALAGVVSLHVISLLEETPLEAAKEAIAASVRIINWGENYALSKADASGTVSTFNRDAEIAKVAPLLCSVASIPLPNWAS
jgi:hypothetical protein